MVNIAEIKKLQIQSRKDKDSINTNILTLVIGEYETAEKRGDSKTVESIIEKLIKNNNEVIKARNETNCVEIHENRLLMSLLPEKATEDELEQFLSENMFSTIPEGLNCLKNGFEKPYDKGLAVKIIKGIISQ